MVFNPLEKSIQSAVKTNQVIGDLFGRLGTAEHPRGAILTAYRNASRAIIPALRESSPLFAVDDVLSQLRRTVQQETSTVLQYAHDFGIAEAKRQLEFYGVNNLLLPSVSTYAAASEAEKVILAKLDAEIAAIMGVLQADLDPVLITGDEDRRGMLSPNGILAAAFFWIPSLLWASYSYMVNTNQRVGENDKQVIATIDAKVTDCCIRAHGQIVPFDGKFKLTGTPRFADEMEWTPFHHRCRSSIVIYQKRFDHGFTERMREAANYVIDQRRQGIRFNQKPASAFLESES